MWEADYAGAMLYPVRCNTPSIVLLVIALFLAVGLPQNVDALNLRASHPRLFMDDADLQNFIDRAKSTEQPYRAAWVDLSNRAKNYYNNWTASPYTGSIERTAFENLIDSGEAMLAMSLYYNVTNNTAYADKVIASLLAFANTTPRTGSIAAGLPARSAGMIAARGLIPVLYAYDLTYNYSGFSTADKAVIEDWFEDYIHEFDQCIADWAANDYYNKQYWQNHVVAAGALGHIAIGAVLGNSAYVQKGFNASWNPRDLLDCITGTILVDGDGEYCVRENNYAGAPFDRNDGEIYDRYRHLTAPLKGLQYATLSKHLLFYAVLIMDVNNTSLWTWTGTNGESIGLPFEYYSDYYRLWDSSLKDGFYDGEDHRIGLAGDKPAVQEAMAQFMAIDKLDYAVTAINRLDPAMMIDDYMGHVILTHGNDDLDYFSVSEFKYVAETGTQRAWNYTNITDIAFGSNTIRGEGTTGHPYFDTGDVSSLNLNLDHFESVKTRLNYDAEVTGDVMIFWQRTTDSGFSTARSATLSVNNTGGFETYLFNLENHPNWNGTLKKLRIDPFINSNGTGKRFWVDYIRIQYDK